MTEKEQLYYLIEHVKTGDYDINTFSDLFTTILNIECDWNTLNQKEKDAFFELEKYTCRFSPFEEDFKNCPNVFYDENTIKEQVDIAAGKLGIDVS